MIEILIAILLVSLCLIPLIQGPVIGYRSELHLLEEMEGERLADLSFSEIKETLFKNKIPWGKLPKTGEKSCAYSLPPSAIQIPGNPPKWIERSFTLRCHLKNEKEGLQGETYRLIEIGMNFHPRLSQRKKDKETNDYSYRLLIQRHNFESAL